MRPFLKWLFFTKIKMLLCNCHFLTYKDYGYHNFTPIMISQIEYCSKSCSYKMDLEKDETDTYRFNFKNKHKSKKKKNYKNATRNVSYRKR